MARPNFTAYKMQIIHSTTQLGPLDGVCEIEARTKADAIMAAQKQAAHRWGLSRTEEALVRVVFL